MTAARLHSSHSFLQVLDLAVPHLQARRSPANAASLSVAGNVSGEGVQVRNQQFRADVVQPFFGFMWCLFFMPIVMCFTFRSMSCPFLQVPSTTGATDLQAGPSRAAAAIQSAVGGAPAVGIQVCIPMLCCHAARVL